MKNYVKYKRKRQQSSVKRFIWIIVSLSVIVMIGIVIYSYKQELIASSIKKMNVLKGQIFLSHEVEKEKSKFELKPAVTQASHAIKPIHFDFYDELPKIQLNSTEKQFSAAPQAEKKEVQELPATVLGTKKQEQGHFSSQSVEQDLYDDLSMIKSVEKIADKVVDKSATYILQMGIFHQLNAANRYRAALQSAGLKVEVVKVKQGSEIVYRLQQGPYHHIEQLKAAKKRVMERGIICDIHKLSASEA